MSLAARPPLTCLAALADNERFLVGFCAFGLRSIFTFLGMICSSIGWDSRSPRKADGGCLTLGRGTRAGKSSNPAAASHLEEIVDNRVSKGVTEPRGPETAVANRHQTPGQARNKDRGDQERGVVEVPLAEEQGGDRRRNLGTFPVEDPQRKPEDDPAIDEFLIEVAGKVGQQDGPVGVRLHHYWSEDRQSRHNEGSQSES